VKTGSANWAAGAAEEGMRVRPGGAQIAEPRVEQADRISQTEAKKKKKKKKKVRASCATDQPPHHKAKTPGAIADSCGSAQPRPSCPWLRQAGLWPALR